MNIHEDVEQLFLTFQKAIKKYPIILVVIVAILAVLLFYAVVEAGESIGDAICGL